MQPRVTDTMDDLESGEFFLAGHKAPMGIYRVVGSRREIRLETGGMLPATCDGRVAVYVRHAATWGEARGRDATRQ